MAPLTRERQAMIEAWTWEFFSKNPGASQHACLRAANNAHIGPYPSIVRAVHQRFQAERLKSMQVLPARPETANGPRVVTPAWVEEEEFPRVEDIKEAEPVASNAKEKSSEETDLQTAARVLLEAMRAHGIEQVLMTVTDTEKPRAEWELTYRKRAAGAVDL